MFGERISVVRLSPASESVGKKSRRDEMLWMRVVS
jgi:hypothetical protein